MKQPFILILLLWVSLMTTSCQTTKYINASTKPAEVNNVSYFAPLAYIRYIEKGNKMVLNDSLSNASKEKLVAVLNKNKNLFRLSQEIIVEDEATVKKVEKEIVHVANLIPNIRKLTGVPVPKTIKSVLDNHQQRFALATVVTGFSRRRGNYNGQVAQAVVIGILSLGRVIPNPIKAEITTYAIIFDAQKNEISYYAYSLPSEKDPTNEQAIAQQLIGLFKNYFYQPR